MGSEVVDATNNLYTNGALSFLRDQGKKVYVYVSFVNGIMVGNQMVDGTSERTGFFFFNLSVDDDVSSSVEIAALRGGGA